MTIAAFSDRVKESCAAPGTSTVTLLGAAPGYQSFAAVGNGNQTYYCIADQNNGSNWEVGIGTYTSSGTTLSRTTVLASSNSGSLVNFSSGTQDVFQPVPATWVNANRGILADVYNFWCANNATTPNTKIDLKVGPAASKFEVVVEAGGVPLTVSSTSTITINTGATGANGLDTGVQAASTWYYIYVIYNQATATVAGLLSLSSTAPTLPSGYTYSALVGAVYSNASTHFQSFNQFNKQVWTPPQNVFTNKTATTANTYQSQGISSIVPPNAVSINGMFGASATGTDAQIAIAADSNGTGAQVFFVDSSAAGSTIFFNYQMGANFSMPLTTAQTFWWQALTNSQATNRVDVCGWTYP